MVRHGQSVANVSPVFQAEDSPLNTGGERQARFIADRVSHLQFDTLVSSPLARTKQAATAISEATGRAIEYSDLFVECMKPEFISGKLHTDVEASRIWHEWEDSFYDSGDGIEGAENYTRVLQRADKALEYLRDRDEE